MALVALGSVVIVGVPGVSHANPFGKFVKSIKIQKVSPPPAPAAQAAPPQQQAAPPAPVQAAPAVPPPAAPPSAPQNVGKGIPEAPSPDKPCAIDASLSAVDHAIARKLGADEELVQVYRVDMNSDGKPDYLITGRDCGTTQICGSDVFISQDEKYLAAFHTDEALIEEAAEVGISYGVTNGVCDLNVGGYRFAWNGKAYKKSSNVRPPKKAKH